MSRCQQVARPVALCLRPRCATQIAGPSISTATARLFSNSTILRDVEPTTTTTASSSAAHTQATADLVHGNSSPDTSTMTDAEVAAKRELKARWLDPNTTTLPWAEKKLIKMGINPVGSRRRRAAVRQTLNIPFEQLPYHCFQEARKLLAEDRAQKLDAIRKAYERLKAVEAQSADIYRGGEDYKFKKLRSLRRHLEYLKVQADMNDPAVKRKFEDGFGMFSVLSVSFKSTHMLIYNSQTSRRLEEADLSLSSRAKVAQDGLQDLETTCGAISHRSRRPAEIRPQDGCPDGVAQIPCSAG